MLEIPSTLEIVAAISNVDIMVDDPSYLSILSKDMKKRIGISLKDYSVPLYEFLFTRLRVCLPLSDFEMVVMDRLRDSPS